MTDPSEQVEVIREAFRYTQAFRERHYDFLRRYVELKSKIDRALAE